MCMHTHIHVDMQTVQARIVRDEGGDGTGDMQPTERKAAPLK